MVLLINQKFLGIIDSADGIAAACETLELLLFQEMSLYIMKRMVKAIYPTPMIGMVGLIEDHKHITTQEFKKSGMI